MEAFVFFFFPLLSPGFGLQEWMSDAFLFYVSKGGLICV